MEPSPRHALSRRGVLTVGAAGVVAGPAVTAAAAALPLVRPISSQAAHDAFGVCALPQLGNSPYRFTSAWMGYLGDLGAAYFRGMYAHRIDATDVATRHARRQGVKWGMTVCPDLSFSDADIRERVRHIAVNAADLCMFVEGVNEPNYRRSTGTVPADWARRAAAKQRVIWRAVKGEPRLAHVPVLGPKLQTVVGTESHYRALGREGIAGYMDFAALACYPLGRYPYQPLAERLRWIRDHWGGKPAWITETGYTNALDARTGHAVTPEGVAGAYGPSLLLEALDHGCRVSAFELLDSIDPGAQDDTEDHFGWLALRSGEGPPWRTKPIVSSMRSLLSALDDPGTAYRPARVPLRVTSAARDVRATVTAKRNGAVTVHLRRARDAWDPGRRQRLAVPEAAVRVETASGSRTVRVDHRVRSVALT